MQPFHIQKFLLVYLFFSLGLSNIIIGQSLTASQSDNDAYIDITWDIPKNTCLTNNGNPYFNGVFIQLLGNGQEIYSETIEDVSGIDSIYNNNYRHQVGPDKNFDYVLNVFERGPGTSLCNTSASGSTASFILPIIEEISTAASPDSIHIRWTNPSSLANNFTLLRDNDIIANFTALAGVGEIFSYHDVYILNNENSLVNGGIHQYCIKAFSELETNLAPVCASGSTLDIGFAASDDTFTDKVELTWNDMSAFADNIHILCNGVIIKTLSSDNINYTDNSPNYGQKSTYGIMLVRNNTSIVDDYDIGSVPKNGFISGKVLTEADLFPVEGVSIIIEGIAGDTIILDSVKTDYAGCFSFPSLYYEAEANFTLTVRKANSTFANTTKNLIINNVTPQNNSTVFYQKLGYTDTEMGIEVSNFAVTPQNAQDKVDLSWAYTPSEDDTTFFNIYRNSNIIARLNDANAPITTYTDLKGVPNTNYTYRLVVFRINEADGQVSDEILSTETTFPVVAPLSQLNVSANTTAGRVDLDWNPGHSSTNYECFRIYRNDILIADVPAGTFAYQDLTGQSGFSYEYKVTAKRNIKEIDYESEPFVSSSLVTYPTLPSVLNFTVQPASDAKDYLEIGWTMPPPLSVDYNYTGFYVYRSVSGMNNFEIITAVDRGAAPAANSNIGYIHDKTGLPQVTYDYYITTYLKTETNLYEMATSIQSETFPTVKTPNNFAATAGVSKIDLTWDAYNANSLDSLETNNLFINQDGFVLYRNGDSLALISVGQTSFTDYINTTNTVNYRLKAFRTLGGTHYFSNTTTATAVPLGEEVDLQTFPTNFIASTDIPNHVKLCWEYPEFAFSEFVLKRNGQVIANLPRTTRAYYDYDAPKTPEVIYSIQAHYEGDLSQEVFTAGSLRYFRSINGRVHRVNSYEGIANVLIRATSSTDGIDYYQQATTDAAGYYLLTDIPCDTANIELDILGQSSDFDINANQTNPQTSATISVNTNQDDYVQNFIDYHLPDYDHDEIGAPVQISATPIPTKMGVMISWSPKNPNYSGFEISRGPGIIKEIVVGEQLSYLDTKGTPGINYGYSVRAFWDTDGGRQYSTPVGINAIFPSLEPVINLTATAINANNSVLIRWSHLYDSHDFYKISRNDVVIGTVNAGEPLMIYDTLGKPGQFYEYAVTGVKDSNESEPNAVRIVFPTTDYPRNITATIPTSETTSSNTLNHVLINWTYTANAANSFEIYRNGQQIGKVNGDVFSFKDYTGIPLTNAIYAVSAVIEREGTHFSSRNDLTVSVTYPVLATPENVSIEVNGAQGALDVHWKYPAIEGADGFYIERAFSDNEFTRIHTLFKDDTGTQNFSYRDREGLASFMYSYRIIAFSFRAGQTYKSDYMSLPYVTYPSIPAPNLISYAHLQNSTTITWTYSNDIKPDGFTIAKNGQELANVGGGTRSFTDIITDHPSSTSITYNIKAYKTINNSKQYSQSSSINVYSLPQDIPNHQTAVGEHPTQFLGQDVAIDGNWMVVGAPEEGNGNGAIYIYHYIGRSWFYHCKFEGNNQEKLGFSVDIFDHHIIAGAPNNHHYEDNGGAIHIYKKNNGNSWMHEFYFAGQVINENFGYDVAINNGKVIIGSPSINRISFFEYNNSNWVYTYGKTLNEYESFGYSVDIDGDDAIIGHPSSGEERGGATIYRYDEIDNWRFTSEIFYFSPNQNKVRFGTDVSISGNSVIISTEHSAASEPAALIYNINGSFWSLEATLDKRNTTSDNIKVVIDGDFAITGARNESVNRIPNLGAIHLYHKKNGDWVFVKDFLPNSPQAGSFYGNALALSGKHIGVGALYYNVPGRPRAGKVYNYLTHDFIQSVEASKGNFSNRTQIKWTFDAPNSLITGFNILRDGVLITPSPIDKSERIYNDNEGLPGKKYLYSVKVKYTEGFEGYSTSDMGYRKANGVLAGGVLTLQSASPVQGVTIKAKAMIENNYYNYETTTNATGSFSIPEVYIGSSDATYTVIPSFPGHDFEPASQTIVLNNTLHEQLAISFLDKTAFVIKGLVLQDNNLCGLDSIKVTSTTVKNDGSRTQKFVFTDENGQYSLAVNPSEANLDSLIIDIEDFKLINRNSVKPDTLYHDFVADGQTIFTNSDFDGFPLETTLNFSDQLTYPVEIRVQNTCNAPISEDVWEIRARTIDGCYDQTFFTHSSGTGKTTINVPPLNLELSVKNVDNLTIPNLTALSYFENKKAYLDLYTLHKDSSKVTSIGDFTGITEDFQQSINRDFTYHKAPQINVNSGFSRFFCNDPNNASILSQNAAYSLGISVSENHNNTTCNVQEGYLKITNAAAENSDPLIIHYDENLGTFPNYDFIAGNPNLIEPHFYLMKIAYFSKNGDFLGDTGVSLFVEGTAPVPGTDIVVNPAQGNQVQLPLFVLRDPPGDGSSSSIAEGSTISKSFNISDAISGSVSLYGKNKISIFGVGGSFNFNASIGGGGKRSKNWKYAMTTTQKISTSSSQTKRGRQANVVVGAGLAMQYGLLQDLRAGDCDTVYQTTRLGFTPNSVNTTWVYTVQQIENIIKEYRNDSLRVEAGTLIYSDGNTVLSKEEAVKRLAVYIQNWEQVMQYHDIETLPHYTLCTRGQHSYLPTSHQNAISEWQNQFCTKIGSYQGDKFTLNDPETIVWDNTLVDLYNAAGTAIRNLSDSIPNPNAPLIWQYDENNPLAQYADAQYNAQFGVLAENFTFGGATSISKSLSAAQTSIKSFSSSFDTGGSIDISLGYSDAITFVIAPFGLGKLQKVVDTEFTLGTKESLKYSISESRNLAESQTVNISYTLADNDVGDQFSVTAIQGPAQNHTPYFSLLGGRSSCPPETGTILRDDAELALVDPATGATASEANVYNISSDEAATFMVKLTNNSIFGETRNLLAFLDNASNTNGAQIRLGGNLLGNQSFWGVPPGGNNAVFLPLTIERGFVSYNHSVRIGLKPLCADGVASSGDISYITVNVNFENPCTPITIASPDDNWVINTVNGSLVVKIRDYQPDNPPLENVRLQYRRLGVGDDFDDIPLRHMKDLDDFVTPQVLQDHNAQIPPNQIPEYFFIWELPTDEFELYPDGQYELRVIAQCTNSETISNIISGTINRSGLRLFGTPEPADGLWTSGDEISFSFNKNLDCNLITPAFIANNFSLIDKSNQDALVPFDVVCLNNKLIFTTTNPMSEYDNHDLEVTLNEVKDINGNGLVEPISWLFHVITQKVYWETDSIRMELFEGERMDITVQLENSTLAETVNGLSLGIADNTIEDNWLAFAPNTNFSVNPNGRTITLSITSDQVRTYSDVLQVNGLTGQIPTLYIEATFKPMMRLESVQDTIMDSTNYSVDNTPVTLDGEEIIDEKVASNTEKEASIDMEIHDIKIIPNPVANSTTIHYLLTEEVPITVTVHSITGTLVETLILNEVQDVGTYSIPFDANGLEDGMYYVLFRAGHTVSSKKMILLRN